MLRRVDKHSGIPAYLQIMNQIKSEILLGNLKAESRLPPVRELEIIFDVNVNTILKALDKLKSEGVLMSEQGIGYFVARNISVDPQITQEIRRLVGDLKSKGLDLYTSLLLIEEVWKNEKL